MNHTPFVIAFNGPPHSGKDSVANELTKQLEASYVTKPLRVQLSLPMRLAVCALLGLDYKESTYDRNKDMVDVLTGETFRQTMIRLSEEHVKPRYGHDYWCRAALSKQLPSTRVIVISDLGFPEEIAYLEKHYGANRVLTVNLTRNGTNWDKDSRVPVKGVQSIQVDNNDTLRAAAVNVRHYMREFLRWNLATPLATGVDLPSAYVDSLRA